jgi:hypothetical protein
VGLFHVTDWLPTLLAGACRRPDLLPPSSILQIDGVNQWDWIVASSSPTVGGSSSSANFPSDSVDADAAKSEYASPIPVDTLEHEVVAALGVFPRQTVLYNADPFTGVAALRRGNWKLLLNESDDTPWLDGDTWGQLKCYAQHTNS